MTVEGEVIGCDRARFERLYRAHFHHVLGYTLRRVDAPEDAADVVAETFLVAWRRLEAVPDGDDARPWLYGVARRVLANQRRARSRQSRLATRLAAELAAAGSEVAAEPPPAAALSAAFARLSEADREVLGLQVWEELTSDGIAHALGCTRGAARVRLHRARRRLAVALLAEGLDREEAPASTEPESHRSTGTAAGRIV